MTVLNAVRVQQQNRNFLQGPTALQLVMSWLEFKRQT